MAAPSGTKWGSVVNNYGKIGLYISLNNTSTKTTVTVQVWFASKYSVWDVDCDLYYNNEATSATTLVDNGIDIDTTGGSGDSGSGWAAEDQVLLKTFTHEYTRGASAQTKNCAAKFDDVLKIGAPMTVTTSYTIPSAPKYTIAYNANGGTGTMTSHTGTYGVADKLKKNTFTRTGYTFKGWYCYRHSDQKWYCRSKTDSSQTAWYATGSIPSTYEQYLWSDESTSNKTTSTDGDTITMYAQWTENSITFKYYSNNASSTNFVNWTAKYASTSWPNNHYNYTSGTYKQTYTGYTATGKYGTTTTGGILVGEDESIASYSAMCTKYGVNLATKSTTINIYCQWTPNTYTVSYNANGGSGTMSNSTATYNANFKTKQNAFTRTGYTFNGWNESADGTGVAWTLGSAGVYESGKDWKWTYTKNITLYAQWTPNAYTVEYKAGLSTGGTLPSKQTRTYPNGVTLGTNSMTKSNTTASGYKVTYANGTATSGTLPSAATATDTIKYTANGWTTGSSNTNDPDYANGASFGSNSTTNLVLYPNFTTSVTRGSVTLGTNSMAKTTTSNGSYTVTFNANGGSCSTTSLRAARSISYTANGWTKTSGSTTRNYTNGQSVQMTAALTLYPCFSQTNTTAAITLPSASRTGYAFKGWSTSNSATSGSTGSYTPTGNVTLYAVWKINTYAVNYNANGGSGAPSAQTKTYGTDLTLSSTTPTRSGYTFMGWGTSASDTSVDYAAGAKYTSNAAITLYAIWRKTVTITYNANGGTGAPSASTGYIYNANTNVSITLSSTKPSRTGYTFKGWGTSTTDTSVDYNPNTAYTFSASATIYAIWTINQYTITINGSSYGTVKNGSTTISSGNKVNYGTVLTITPTSATGYTTTAASSTGTISSNKLTVDGNETITFTRTGNTYTVEYKQGLASSTTNLPAKQNRTYPNAVTLATNSMTKNSTTAGGYTLAYGKGLSTSGTLPSNQTATDTTKYTANGWTTNSSNYNVLEYNNGASFGSNSTTNLILYPNFSTALMRGNVTVGTNNMSKSNTTANSYTVSYANGTATSGTLPSTQTSINTTTYTKNGWTTSSSNTNDPDYANGATISKLSSHITLYPNFTTSTTNGGVKVGTNSMAKSNTTANSYTVSYAQGNASNATNLPSTQTSINTTKYTANGWTTTSGSTSRTYANGAATGALSKNITLYPCFSQTTTNGGVTVSSNTMSKSNTTSSGYKVTYAQGSATSTTVPSAQTATDTTSYTHAGWATSASGSKAYNKGAATGALTKNITLYPYFSSSLTRGSVTLATNSMTKSNTSNGSYTVTLNVQGGTSSSTSLSAARSIKYTANGWTKTSGSTTRNYTNGQSVQMTAALALYPCFSQTNLTAAVTLPTPTRAGFTFKGWNTKADGSGTNYAAAASYTPSANVTLYAIWDYIGVVRIGSNKYLPYAYIDGAWQRLMPYVYDTTNKVWKETGAND